MSKQQKIAEVETMLKATYEELTRPMSEQQRADRMREFRHLEAKLGRLNQISR